MIHEFTPQNSSNIWKLKLDDISGVLTVTFKLKNGDPGDMWEYFGVSQSEYDALVHPIDFEDSHGRAFHHVIRQVKTGRQVR